MLGSYRGSYRKLYSRLPVDEKETVERSVTWWQLAWRAYLLVLHFSLALILGYVLLPLPPPTCLLRSELPFARPSLRYIETTFTPSGFTDGPDAPSPYLGPPSAARDALWEALYDVGNVVISRGEADQLNVSTTGLVNEHAEVDESHRLLTLEVFHQLHCLDYVRHASYGQSHHPGESEWSKSHHVDHCIDYLRQVLMCHGDMTPITMEHVPGVPALPWPNRPPYKPNFAIQHTCRDFDMIYDFALQRNTSDYKVA